MSNHLKLAMIERILSLRRKGWSRAESRTTRSQPRDCSSPPQAGQGRSKTSHCAPRPGQSRGSAKTSHCAPRLEQPGHGAQSRCPAAGLNSRWHQSIPGSGKRLAPLTHVRARFYQLITDFARVY